MAHYRQLKVFYSHLEKVKEINKIKSYSLKNIENENKKPHHRVCG
jgi:hypothetical protein